MHKKMFVSALSLLLLIPFGLSAHPKMYFAHPYQFDTRFERKGLITVDSWIAHGNTTKGQNSLSKTTNVLNIYGSEKMHQIGKNVVGQGLGATNKTVLTTLWRNTPTSNDENYGTLQFSGKCNYTGGAVSFGFNITDELFFGCELPFYKLDIKDITFIDKTATVDQDAEWNQFYVLFDSILSDVGLSRLGIKKSGIGDISIYTGWTRSTEDLENLEFLDATLKFGVLLGTAAEKNEDFAFSVAPGYDKHNGVFISFDTAIGITENASFGFHLNELFLLKKSKTMRVKTALGQNGFIKLAKTKVERDMGNLYDIGGHFKLEYGRAAFYTGYTYAHQGGTSLTSQDSKLYPGSILNTDEMLKDWSMHTLNLGAELDFSNDETQRIHPKCGICYNHVLRARRAFLNDTVAGSIGFSITFEF